MRPKKFLTVVLVMLFIMLETHVYSISSNACASENSGNSESGNKSGSRPESADAHIISIVPITEVFADGWKVSAVSVEYDKNISDASLSPSDYIVKTDVAGQKITRVYTSTDGEKTAETRLSGQYVILELSTDYVIPVQKGMSFAPPKTGTPPSTRPAAPKIDSIRNSELVRKVGNISWDPTSHPATLVSTDHGGNGKAVSVTQVRDITTTDGMTIPAGSSAKDNYYDRNLIVDGFMKPDYIGSDKSTMKYNIHFPRNYDPNKKYPVVVFMPDANSITSGTHADVLIRQGIGAVVWADKDEEARHAAIVVVPLSTGALVNESYEAPERQGFNGAMTNPYLTTLGLMDYMMEQIPNIDKERIYITGQGDGARAAIKMLMDRPNMLAAALLFAPDYDRVKISNLSKANMWIVASEGDDTSYPNMEGCIDSLKAAGARISKAAWNGQANAAQFASDVSSMIKEGNNIKYTVLKKGTVVPSGVSDDAINNRAYTWRTGYSIKGLRDWLFSQHSSKENP